MKTTIHTRGLYFGKTDTSSVRCGECGQLLCRICQEHCTSIFLHTICKCGHSGYLSYGTALSPMEPYAKADFIDNHISCDECRKLLFCITDQVSSFAFRAQCSCGRKFNRAYRRKRKLYDAQKFLQTSLHNIHKSLTKKQK